MKSTISGRLSNMNPHNEDNRQEFDLFALKEPLKGASPDPPPPEEKPAPTAKKEAPASDASSPPEKKPAPTAKKEAPASVASSPPEKKPASTAKKQPSASVTTSFSDEKFPSTAKYNSHIPSVERAQMGITGLDEMLSGGLIRGSVAAIIGQYGTGKTSFAVHFALEGLQKGESVLYIALEERRERLLQYMSAYGVDIKKSIDSRKLLVINLDPSDFNLAIQGVKNEIPALIKKTQADRFIIDPISLFEDLFDDDATRRRELMRFLETLRDMTNCTFLFTSETNRTDPLSSRYNLIEYLSDTVISLRYVRSVEASEVHLAVEVIKMRLSSHFREAKPFELKSGMIEVYIDANVF